MTLEETKQILQVLQINYPQSYKGWTKQQTELFLQLWSTGLKNESILDVKTAVWHFIMESDRDFAPSIGQIRSWLNKNPRYYVRQLAVSYFPNEVKQLQVKNQEQEKRITG